MTNYSLVNNWSLKLSVVDIAWGGFINSVASLIAKYLEIWLT